MARVTHIVTTVHLDDGSAHTIVSDQPAPQGDNPAYLAQQVVTGLQVATERLVKVVETYGPQIRPE